MKKIDYIHVGDVVTFARFHPSRALDALMHLRERKGSALTIVFKDGSQYTVIEGTAEQAEAA